MKLHYFGTAAAEGFPAMFCRCEYCIKAYESGGRNIRTRSQALVDDAILVDFPADTFMHVLYGGLRLPDIEHCLITHHHSDHLYAADFTMRLKSFAHPLQMPTLNVYGTPGIGEHMEDVRRRDNPANPRVVFHSITPYVAFPVGSHTVTALHANHASASDPVIYLISHQNTHLLYAHDTGSLPTETLDALRESRVHLDFISMDCTNGILSGCRDYHLGLDTVAEALEALKRNGNANGQTGVCLNHFSHNGHATYDDMVSAAASYGFAVSYDGMTICF